MLFRGSCCRVSRGTVGEKLEESPVAGRESQGAGPDHRRKRGMKARDMRTDAALSRCT